MSGRQIFRQAALDRLASPEQLDRMVTITDTRGWIALAVCGSLLASLVVWSVAGAIPDQVTGQGILMSRGGRISDASSQATGTLVRFTVAVNDNVSMGQVVAVVDQRESARRSADAGLAVSDQEAALLRFDRDYRREVSARANTLEMRRRTLLRSVTDGESRTEFLARLLARQEGPGQKGFFSERSLDDARAEISRVKQEVADRRNELARLDNELLEAGNQYERERSKHVLAINEARRVAGQYALVLARDSTVVANVDGRVIELKLAPGAIVQQGQAVLSIEKGGTELNALVYMPTEHGKKLAVGQEVRLAPANVKKEEYGTLRGTVRSISEFPMTLPGIVSVLPNPALAGMFAKDGPPYAVQVDLVPDASLRSGYQWTSAEGPPFPLASGTTVNAEVTVDEQRPISLLIPFLRKTSGLYLH